MLLRWEISRGTFTSNDTLANTGMWRKLAFEISLVLTAPAPFFDGIKFQETVSDLDITLERELNSLLMALSIFFRAYLLFRFVCSISYFMSPRAQRVGTMNGCSANVGFAFKCLMRERPI